MELDNATGWSGGVMVLVNFQFRGVLLILLTAGQGSSALAVDSVGSCLDIFPLVYQSSLFSPSLWETAR